MELYNIIYLLFVCVRLVYVHACRGVVSDNYSQNIMCTRKIPGCLGSCISSDDIII